MASSYSTNLAIELIGTGDQAGTWGTTTNTNLGTLIEQAISGYVTQAVSTGTDTTITIPNGATGVARNMYIELTGTGGASTNLIVPSNKKLYFVFNNTASGQVTVKVSGQTGVSVPNGAKMILVSDGTDIVDATNYVGNISAASGNITTLTSASATITNLIATSASITTLTNNPTFGAGTANGVLYLDGSKVATSGTALSYDGTTLSVVGGNGNAFKVDNTGQQYTSLPLYNNNAIKVNHTYDNTNSKYILYTQNSDPITFAIGGITSEAMRLTSTGLGIGTNSPAYKLDVRGSTDTSYLNITSTADANNTTLRIGTDATAAFINATGGSSGTLQLQTYGTTRATIDSSGNVGIGTSSPAVPLDIACNSGSNGINLRARTGNDYSFINFKSTDGSETIGSVASLRSGVNTGSLLFYTGTVEKARLDSSGNLGIGTSSPTHKLQVSGSGRFGSMSTGPGLLSGSSDTFQVGLNQDNTNTTNTQVWAEYVNGASSASWAVRYRAANDTGTASTRLFLDAASGNLGLGVTPSAWNASFKAIQLVGGWAALSSNDGTGAANLTCNAYATSTSDWAYGSASSYRATRYSMGIDGIHSWYTSPQGTAGNTISFTQAMTLDASGNLLVGTTTANSGAKVTVGASGGGVLALQRGTGDTTSLLGEIRFGNENVDGKLSAIESYQGGATDSSDLRFYTSPTGGSQTERARLDSAGNLGLGVTPTNVSGSKKLEVGGAVNSAVVLSTNSSNAAARNWATAANFNAFGDYVFLQSNALGGDPVSAGTTRMTLDASGNLGIGTSNPGEKLAVNGSIGLQRSGTQYWHYGVNASNALVFTRSAVADRLTLDSDGNLGLGVTPSAWSGLKAIQVENASLAGWTSDKSAMYLSANSYYDGSNFKYISNEAANQYRQQAGAHAWYNAASGTAGGTISFTQAMTLDASGNLLVGATSAAGTERLNVVGGIGIRINEDGSGTKVLSLRSDFAGAGPAVNVSTNHPLLLQTNNTERARITSGGELLVGATSYAGSNTGIGLKPNATSWFTASGDYPVGVNRLDSDGIVLDINRSTVRVGSISVTTTATAYNTSSDRRLKENIASSDDAGAVIDAIEIVKHDWKAGGHTRYGAIAQDLYAVVPEAVAKGDDGEEIEQTWGVDYSKLVPMLVKEIQSLRKRVAELEAK